jgi:hypothetical protein
MLICQGHSPERCVINPSKNNDYVKKNVNLTKWDWLNTYTAACIAVQCWRNTWLWDKIKEGDQDYEEGYTAYGPAQITDKQAQTPYGEEIKDANGDNRDYGLSCYAVRKFSEKL